MDESSSQTGAVISTSAIRSNVDGGGWNSTTPSDALGKHRLLAAIKFLNQEIEIIQKELTLLETVGQSSIVCKEFTSSVEFVPDPLLPMTIGPANVSWERWFQGAKSYRKGSLFRSWISDN